MEQQNLALQQAQKLAQQHYVAGRLTEAESICHQILQGDPDQPVTLHLLGIISLQEGNEDHAVEHITKALAIQPDYAEAHTNLGIALKAKGRLDDAIESHLRALTINPEMANAHFNLGNVLRVLGKLDDAIDSYRRAIAIKPDTFVMLETLADTLQAQGRPDEAAESYQKALAINPEAVETHARLGDLFLQRGLAEDAIFHFRRALNLSPEYAEVHASIGICFKNKGLVDDAVASFTRAIEINPDLAMAHNSLGNALDDLGRLDDSCYSYRKAIAIDSNYVEAHSNLGLALMKQGLKDEAAASFQTAIHIYPDFAEAHSGLGFALKDLGKQEDAIACHRRAVALKPENELLWSGFANSLIDFTFTAVDEALIEDLFLILERPTVRPAYITRPIISALRLDKNFSQILELTASGAPDTTFEARDAFEKLSLIPLFLRILSLVTINDLEIERMLTFLRRAMIEETLARKTEEKSLPFSVALALQCYTNEFVYFETDEEKEIVGQLSQLIADLVEKGQDVPPSFIASLGAYRALYEFPWAGELSERAWAGGIGDVIGRQILEPLEELTLRSHIPSLTDIKNTVSISVKKQYEENPYPRWIKTGLANSGRSFKSVLHEIFQHDDPGESQSPNNPEILIAGCGTGQHSINTASMFSNSRVLAVDLSLTSLSYALRKTNELEVPNIEYAQADLMELESFERRFDLIECVGTLVCIAEPLAGWRILVDLLRPGGLMKIGLYSEIARQDVISGRAMIAKEGYTSSTEDIRRFRKDIINKIEDGNPELARISNTRDFFSISELRDMLFHVQEHLFTLPWIESALEDLNLKFLGFGTFDQGVLKKFKESHPGKNALTSLALWHEFEMENPQTFRNMYQFWCQKI